MSTRLSDIHDQNDDLSFVAMPRQGVIVDWLDRFEPSDPEAIATFRSSTREEVEFGFVKAIEMSRVGWIEAFVLHLGCSPDRFLEDSERDCPLSYAINNGPPASVAKLLALGADPNILINRKLGHRPLHVAVDLETTDHKILSLEPPPTPYTELLVAYGADPLLRDFSGLSPLDLTIREGRSSVKALLEEAVSSPESTLRGRRAMAIRIADMAGQAIDFRSSLFDTDIVSVDTLRRLVELAVQHDDPAWLDDDLIRLSHWLAELGDPEDAATAALRASTNHPYRAISLMGIAILTAGKNSDTQKWRELMSISLESSFRIRRAWLRIEPYVAAGLFLVQRGERDSGRRMLDDARKILAEAGSCWQRDQALAELSYRFFALGLRMDALGITRLIDDSKVRWRTRRDLLLQRFSLSNSGP